MHFHEGPDAMQDIVETADGRLVYQSHETSPIAITKRYHPANTNPLLFKRTALFRFESRDSSEAALEPGVLNRLQEAGGEVSVQLYRRVAKKDALPSTLGKLWG